MNIKIKKTLCVKCSREISNSNYKKHYNTCDGTYFTGPHKPNKKSFEEIEKRKREHIEDLRLKNIGRPAWNKGLTKDSDIRVKKYSEANTGNSKIGRCLDPQKELERRQKLSNSAKKQGFGGYNANAGHSKKFKVIDSYGNLVTLQSTYELECSKILNDLNILWTRPKSLTYDNRKYYPDFYLPEYDVYLDPKNSYKAEKDFDKIRKVVEQNSVKVFVLLQEQLTPEYIASVIQ